MNRNRGPLVPGRDNSCRPLLGSCNYGTMGYKREDAKGYRDRAEELRTKADVFSEQNHDMLLQLADLYDRFANEVEAGYWDSAGPH